MSRSPGYKASEDLLQFHQAIFVFQSKFVLNKVCANPKNSLLLAG